MKITLPLTDQNYLLDAYGKYSAESERSAGNCILSFPISLDDVPQGTQSLALAFYDFDSIPVCGFVWIHWLACNIDPSTREIPEGAARDPYWGAIQGSNSVVSRFNETVQEVGVQEAHKIVQGYIGPCPPDKDHQYTLRVYALDVALDLEAGYFANTFHWAIQDHILDMVECNFWSRA